MEQNYVLLGDSTCGQESSTKHRLPNMRHARRIGWASFAGQTQKRRVRFWSPVADAIRLSTLPRGSILRSPRRASISALLDCSLPEFGNRRRSAGGTLLIRCNDGLAQVDLDQLPQVGGRAGGIRPATHGDDVADNLNWGEDQPPGESPPTTK